MTKITDFNEYSRVLNEYYRILKVKGDGNCGPRAILQSLLVQGLVHDKKDWVLGFITELAEVNADSRRLTKPDTFNKFIECYKTLTLEQLDDFSQEFFIKNVNSDTTVELYSDEDLKNIHDLLSQEETADSKEKLGQLLKSEDNSAIDDSVIYFLSACLRQDLVKFYSDTNLFDGYFHNKDFSGKEDELACLGEPDNYMDLNFFSPYLTKKNIDLTIYEKQENALNYQETKLTHSINSEISISIIYQGDHFDVLLDEELAKKLQIQRDEAIAKALQIQADEESAKALQIEEMENFFSNKTPESQNRSDFTRFIRYLGLEGEISTACHFINQLIDMFKSVITRLGYSSGFAGEIKDGVKNCSSDFFSTAKQIKERPTDDKETLKCTI